MIRSITPQGSGRCCARGGVIAGNTVRWFPDPRARPVDHGATDLPQMRERMRELTPGRWSVGGMSLIGPGKSGRSAIDCRSDP